MTMQNLSMDELRDKLDEIDRQLATLISERANVIRALAARKIDDEILVPEHSSHMVAIGRQVAAQPGGDPGVVDEAFRKLSLIFEELELMETRDHPRKRRVPPQPLS
jgi:chorismate mutase